jgi:hypothetical protein
MLTRANLNNQFLLLYALEHVWYETHMVFDVGFLLDNSGFTSESQYFNVVLRNLVIDGFPVASTVSVRQWPAGTASGTRSCRDPQP